MTAVPFPAKAKADLATSDLLAKSHPQSYRKFSRAIWIGCFVVLALLPINYLQHRLLGWSTLTPLRIYLLNFHLKLSDSWMPMRAAFDYVQSQGKVALYQEIFFNQHIKFQYPPTALLPLWGFQLLGIHPTNDLLNNINRCLVPINAVGVGWLFRLVLERTLGPGSVRLPSAMAGTILVGCATLLFYPLMVAFWLGQIQVWIDTGFTFACIAMLTKRKVVAGVLVGLICLLKPQFAAFILWAPLRRQWWFTLGMIAVTVPSVFLSVSLFGLAAHLDYLHVLAFLGRHGEAMITNNSVNGILHYLVGDSHNLIWNGGEFPRYNALVHVGSTAGAVVFVLAAFLPWRQFGPLSRLMDLQFAALAFTMGAPIAWEHHYGIVAPMLATLFATSLARAWRTPRRADLLACAAIFLVSATCVTTNLYNRSTDLNWAVGYLFFAGLGILIMLRRAKSSIHEDDNDGPEPTARAVPEVAYRAPGSLPVT